jgi:hypothetical protein
MRRKHHSHSINRKSELARERLRKRYRPSRVRVLFVGEAPPASGRFFYQADSGLYRAVREAFASVLPNRGKTEFLELFQALGCYLVDLCGRPVDRLPRNQRSRACRENEVRLTRILERLRPKIMITVVRSIAGNVERSQQRAGWVGDHLELPYPGRWQHHRKTFLRELASVLRKIYPRRPAKPAFWQGKV